MHRSLSAANLLGVDLVIVRRRVEPQHFSRAHTRVLAAFYGDCAVDDDQRNSLGFSFRVIVGCSVVNGIRIENHQIGETPFGDAATAIHPEG